MRVVEQVVQRTGGCPIPGNIPGIFQFVLCTDFQALSSLICWRSLPMAGVGWDELPEPLPTLNILGSIRFCDSAHPLQAGRFPQSLEPH